MRPKISVVVPFHWMKNWQFFLTRCLESIEKQTFRDYVFMAPIFPYEVILIKHSTMPITSNRVIESAKGEIIKVLYMDDWLESENYLEKVYEAFLDPKAEWLITAATNNPNPMWTDDIETGNNKLGSPSALAFRKNYLEVELFDERLSWALDCDLYKRLEYRFGKPVILTDVSVGIGIHDGQMSNILNHQQKAKEINYLIDKHG